MYATAFRKSGTKNSVYRDRKRASEMNYKHLVNLNKGYWDVLATFL